VGVNPRQFPLISTLQTTALLLVWVCCSYAASAQVAQISIETKVEPTRFDLGSLSPQTLEAPVLPRRRYEGNTRSLMFPLIPHRHHRTLLSMNERFRDQLIDQACLDIQMRLPERREVHRWNSKPTIPGMKERMLIASHQEIGNRRTWSAHLQRADFEVLAAELSLSDINRYQFRRNRPHTEGVPVSKAGGED
jgi:hypothetical protein